MEGERGRRLTAAVKGKLGGWKGFRMGAGAHREKKKQRGVSAHRGDKPRGH